MSDIHGNLLALQAVVAALPPCDRVLVAGDHCLDGPRPAEVLDLLQELSWTLILGNTDRDLTEPSTNLKKNKARRVAWTREQLGGNRLHQLALLPHHETVPLGSDTTLLAVHANPVNLEDHLYPTMTEDELQMYVEGVGATIIAFGHLHIPYIRRVAGMSLVDVASVGHPKDRDLRAAFTVIRHTDGILSIEQVRVPYDIEGTVRQLNACDMPGAAEQAQDLLRASY